MKALFAIIFILHALIHLLGFVKAFELAKVSQLTGAISRPVGLLWLLTALLLAAGIVLFILNHAAWWMVALPAVVLSQLLIILSWTDAKFGTIANVLVLVVIVINASTYLLENGFHHIVDAHLRSHVSQHEEQLSEADIVHLPAPVQKYLRYSGSMGKPKVGNFKAVFRGGIRFKPGEDYMPLSSIQYNFMAKPARLFYILAKKNGLPAVGLHYYQDEHATFQIKLLGLFNVVDARGKKMDQGETVTVFNDMCFIAPATLIDRRITWEAVDDRTAKAVYGNGDIAIRATLFFNEKGELVNFVSDDRFETDGKSYKSYPWSTPVTGYRDINGYRLPAGARLIYSRPDGEFCYGEFQLEELQYNVTSR